VGYDAYYAARLALKNAGNVRVELLAVDDGESVASAAQRAAALAKDPLISVVIALGYSATDAATQHELAGLPMMVVGEWQAKPEIETVFILTSQELSNLLTAHLSLDEITAQSHIDVPAIGNEVFALELFAKLTPEYRRVTIASSGSLPDETFREEFMNSGLYVPKPSLLATLTYDAVGAALAAMLQGSPATALANQSYTGINGTIRFENGYWVNAPIHLFGYDDNGELTPVDRPVK
jgi:ABC-type branched-subunit amino acid transport system substrate-binding protein